MKRGTSQSAWSLLLLLLLVVLVPTVFLLWFMVRAVENERFAVRSRLVSVYEDRMAEIADDFVKEFDERLDVKGEALAMMEAGEVFGRLVQSGACHGAVVYDERGGVLYPDAARVEATPVRPDPEGWRAAERLEFRERKYGEAAAAYGAWAAARQDVSQRARGLMAQARCLKNAGDVEGALAVLRIVAGDDFVEARGEDGRWIGPNAQLRMLQLVPNQEWDAHGLSAERLLETLVSYAPPIMPSGQRLFLLKGLPSLQEKAHPTLVAESLAAAYVEAERNHAGDKHLVRTAIPDLYHIGRSLSDGRRVVLLFQWGRLGYEFGMAAAPRLDEAAFAKLYPPDCPVGPDPLLTGGVTEGALKDWKFSLFIDRPNPFEEAAERRVVVYLWSGIVVILSMATLALLVARRVVQQVRLTRLRNELIATVSHELKTPLASMRVLVDTLLEGRCQSDRQRNEYLELIAKENKRLSHLIDNFLTFSRMERNKQAFDSASVSVKEVVDGAIDAAGARFQAPGCQLTVDVAEDLPAVQGDRDALTTVLLNLLDNAYKYSREERHIEVKAFGDNGRVCLQVRDNGIGMSRRARRKAFERFYQEDRSLSREVGGCGLGLSIVHFIVKAHGGSVEVESEAGKGSTFTVRLPADERRGNGG